MLTLRNANIKDAEVLLSWRNDPETRLASHHSGKVEFVDHCRWLASSLENPNRTLYIAEKHGKPVGTVRIDYSEDGSAEVSWTVCPQNRAQGIGKMMVRMAADRVSPKHTVRAEVKSFNIASIKVAKFAGMTEVSRVGDVIHYSR